MNPNFMMTDTFNLVHMMFFFEKNRKICTSYTLCETVTRLTRIWCIIRDLSFLLISTNWIKDNFWKRFSTLWMNWKKFFIGFTSYVLWKKWNFFIERSEIYGPEIYMWKLHLSSMFLYLTEMKYYQNISFWSEWIDH